MLDDFINPVNKNTSINCLVKFFNQRFKKVLNPVTLSLLCLLILESSFLVIFMNIHYDWEKKTEHLYRVSPKVSQVMKIEYAACSVAKTKEQKIICDKISSITRNTVFVDTDALVELGLETSSL